MKTIDLLLAAPGRLAIALALTAASASTAAAQGGGQTNPRAPLVLDEQGSFYVNGELTFLAYPCGTSRPPIPNYCDPGHIVSNQMYVQYQIPKGGRKKGTYPVVMVHGGSHMGNTYDATPDGREGWRTLFLRAGFPVYVVDQPGVARSSFNPSRVNEAQVNQDASLIPAAAMRISTLEQIWSFYRFGPQYPTLNPGSQFPADAITQYLSQMVPNTDAFMSGPSASIRIEALAELLDKIGPAIILTHSASGPHGFAVVAARPGLVKGLISVEPAGCSVPAANRPAFVGVATLTLFGDFIAGNTGCQNTTNQINAAGGNATMVLLPEVGIFGNSHMLILEKNNHVVADWLVSWIRSNVN
jgi:pimeloyl-ACP methyl ester carboxylesterase